MNRNTRTPEERIAAALVIGLLLTAGSATTAHAQDQSGGVPGEWLSRYAGARTVGIGGAYVAMANEPMGMLWNPAGLTRMFQNEAHFESATLFEGTSLYGFGFAIPSRRFPSIGLSVMSLRSGEFEKTNELNEPQGSFREGNMAFVLSGSQYVHRRVSVGANLRVVRHAIDEWDGAGVGFDVGAMVDVTSNFRVGTSVLNIAGPSVTLREAAETYPTEIRGGFAMDILSGRGVLSAEVDHRSGPGVSYHAGTEFWVHRSMALRVGYYGSEPAGGFSYRIKPEMRLDYGVSDHDLGITHRMAISYRFGGFYASSEAKPSVFSPLGEQAVTKFELKAQTKAEPVDWELEIVDDSGMQVRKFSGRFQPPPHVMWDGKDEFGRALADGHYKYRLRVTDEEGQVIVAKDRTVEIATTGPRGDVPLVIE